MNERENTDFFYSIFDNGAI